MSDPLLPPSDIEAEQNVLGILIFDSEMLYKVFDRLSEDMFFNGTHRQIWSAICSLHHNRKPIDLVTVSGWLKEQGHLQGVEDREYVSALVTNFAVKTNLEYLVDKLREFYNRRELIKTCKKAMAAAYDLTQDAKDVLETTAKSVGRIAETAASDTTPLVGDFIDAELESLRERMSTGQLPGLQTGFNDFDSITHGLNAGGVYILAARPGMGKSAFGFQLCQNVAEMGGRVIIESLEMTKSQIVKRMISVTANVEHDRLETGSLTPQEFTKIEGAVEKIRPLKLHIREASGSTMSEIASHARRVKFEHKDLKLVAIDYMQLVKPSKSRAGDTRNNEVSEISAACKALAVELKVPVVVLSQLSRGVEMRQDKRPMLSDLRDSGSIEQDADVVLFLYRPDYYDKETDRRGEAEVIIAKNRHGAVGTIDLLFQNSTTKFLDKPKTNLGGVQDFTPRYNNPRAQRY